MAFRLLRSSMKIPWFVIVVAALLVSGATAVAQRPAPPDPTKVDDDFDVQGEYVGVIREQGHGQKYGVRLATHVNVGEFKAIAFRGGLPGDGWDKKLTDERNK